MELTRRCPGEGAKAIPREISDPHVARQFTLSATSLKVRDDSRQR